MLKQSISNVESHTHIHTLTLQCVAGWAMEGLSTLLGSTERDRHPCHYGEQNIDDPARSPSEKNT